MIILAALAMATTMGAQAQTKSVASGDKVLITYFSRRGQNYTSGGIVDLKVGNTEVVAGKIQKLTGGDMFYIEPAAAYPADYNECTRVAKDEQTTNARPKFKGEIKNFADYDVIYLGYPNWWDTMPMTVWTFLETYDFGGKTIIPFCTHEGSRMGRSEQDIKTLCPKATVMKGLPIKGSNVQNADKEIEKWVLSNK